MQKRHKHLRLFLISQYVDGEIAGDVRHEVEIALSECSYCTEQVAILTSHTRSLAHIAVKSKTVPPAVTAGIRGAIEAERQRQTLMSWLVRGFPAFGGTAVAAALLLIASQYVGSNVSPRRPLVINRHSSVSVKSDPGDLQMRNDALAAQIVRVTRGVSTPQSRAQSSGVIGRGESPV